jgi:hypothetical protein
MKRILAVCVMLAWTLPACIVQEDKKEPTLEEQVQDWIDEGMEELYGTDTNDWPSTDDETDTFGSYDPEAAIYEGMCNDIRACHAETLDIIEEGFETTCTELMMAEEGTVESRIASCLWDAWDDSERGQDCDALIWELYDSPHNEPWVDPEDGSIRRSGCLVPAVANAE